MEERYISFEIAKLLQRKGFNEPCILLYDNQGRRHFTSNCHSLWSNTELAADEWSCCSQYVALQWLRKEKNIFIDICTLSPTAYSYRVSLVSDTTGYLYENYACEESGTFMNYEDAIDAALSYVLENILNEE